MTLYVSPNSNNLTFIHTIKDLNLDDQYLFVSFDVVSFFTKIPVSKALDISSKFVYFEILNLVKTTLTSTLFSFKGKLYDHMKGTTMGSSLCLVVARLHLHGAI